RVRIDGGVGNEGDSRAELSLLAVRSSGCGVGIFAAACGVGRGSCCADATQAGVHVRVRARATVLYKGVGAHRAVRRGAAARRSRLIQVSDLNFQIGIVL